MASRQSIVDFITEQAAAAGNVSCRKMFGEFALYCDGKLVALICDNLLFVKPTAAGRNFIGTPIEAPPYSGAKPSFRIDEGYWEDRDWLSDLIRLTATELPEPAPKKVRKKT